MFFDSVCTDSAVRVDRDGSVNAPPGLSLNSKGQVIEPRGESSLSQAVIFKEGGITGVERRKSHSIGQEAKDDLDTTAFRRAGTERIYDSMIGL